MAQDQHEIVTYPEPHRKLSASTEDVCNNSPAISSGGRSKHRRQSKKVRWEAEVIDNEYKMKSRPKVAKGSKDNLMNESRRIDSAPSQTHKSTPSFWEKKYPGSHANYSQGLVKPVSKLSAKREPQSLSQGDSHHYHHNQRLREMVEGPPPISPRHLDSIKSHINRPELPPRPQYNKIRHPTVPPKVPEPPSRRPPPAPRPARLPTPDLPEIDGSMFFPDVRSSKNMHADHDARAGHAEAKMNAQLAAAKTYMKPSRALEKHK